MFHCFLNREFELSEIFSPHDAALDGTISGTDGLLVRDCSLHPGDLWIPNGRVNPIVSFTGTIRTDLPVVDDLRVELNLNDLTTLMTEATREFGGKYACRGRKTHEMVNMGSNNETLSLAAKTVVNGNNVAWLQVRRSLGVKFNDIPRERGKREDERR